jgi:hypothetical protein
MSWPFALSRQGIYVLRHLPAPTSPLEPPMTGPLRPVRRPGAHALPGAAIIASALLGAAACSSASSTAAAAGHPATTSSQPRAASSPGKAAASASPSPVAVAASTPAGTMAGFVTDILEKDYHGACLLVLPTGANARPSASQCSAASKTFSALHGAWTKSVVTLPPAVRVTSVASKGTTATVPDTGITADGYTLNKLELIGATPGASISLSFALTRHKGTWYISNMNGNFG